MRYIEIIIESFGVYFYLIFMLRILGKKEMSKLSISDLIVFLIISELMTISIGEENIQFFHGALAVFIIVVLDKVCSYLVMRFKSIRKILEGHPTYIIYNGVVDQKKMNALNYTVDDLCHHLRQEGVGSISEVAFAVLEKDGNLSVIEKQKNQTDIPESLISNGEINNDALILMNKDEKWLLDLLKKEGIHDYHTLFYCVKEKDGLFYIKK